MIRDGGGGPPDRPDPDSRNCDQCGHVWFAGERHHQFLDSSPDNVEILCALCLHQHRLALSETPTGTSSPVTRHGWSGPERRHG